jgi:DNA-binding response OmpR family regulator
MMEAKSTILIADDEKIGREALQALLFNQGYHIFFATNGSETLALAAKLTPDVILLDVMMPDMDGFEVCQRLRANPSLAEIPIIMVTALDDPDSRQRGIEVGADEFLSKPFERAELRARVRTITKINRYHHLLIEQAKFKWVAEQANEGYLILDHHEKILYANPQARLYLEQSQAEPITEKFSDLAKKQYHCEPQETWENGLEYSDEQTRRYLVRPETSTAYAFWLQVDVMETLSGQSKQYLVRLSDVTDSISLKRQKWTFQGQVNHKLRTPLIPINSATQYLKEHFLQMTSVKIKEFLDMIHTGGLRLQSEIEEVLGYLNVSKKAYIGVAFCNLSDLQVMITAVKERLNIESVFMDQQNITDPENIYIYAPCQMMELILTEVFSNSKKFHPTGSPSLEISVAMLPKAIRLQIRDDGLRLSPKQLAGIWTPYYQGDKFATGEIQGMGLGLSMVASLIWNIGGTCRAYNRIDIQGVMIELTLPLTE